MVVRTRRLLYGFVDLDLITRLLFDQSIDADSFIRCCQETRTNTRIKTEPSNFEKNWNNEADIACALRKKTLYFDIFDILYLFSIRYFSSEEILSSLFYKGAVAQLFQLVISVVFLHMALFKSSSQTCIIICR